MLLDFSSSNCASRSIRKSIRIKKFSRSLRHGRRSIIFIINNNSISSQSVSADDRRRDLGRTPVFLARTGNSGVAVPHWAQFHPRVRAVYFEESATELMDRISFLLRSLGEPSMRNQREPYEKAAEPQTVSSVLCRV